ncbi:MAG: lactate utilization protein B [Acidimicrobiia bacterium]
MSGHQIVTPGATMRDRTEAAVADTELQSAISNLDRRLFTARAVADSTPDMKDRAAAIRRETLADLDGWIDRLAASLTRVGAQVHHAATPEAACAVVAQIARTHNARRIVKSKSMATEEINLNVTLEAQGFEVLETDLGEYIIQVAGERPSHMITPAIHKTLDQIAQLLSEESGETLPADRDELTSWVRERLRARMLRADIGVTGANFACADTGTIALVTNEGNADYCTTVPPVHVAIVPIEKVIPRFSDLPLLLPLLTRSATGQALTNYVTMFTGPRRAGETDGPEELHVVLLDHNRRALVGTPYEEMLACIRCGACLNVCPVYRSVSGHAYDTVYTGPMGKVLMPLLTGGEDGRALPFASTLCGACTEACPVEIPLADLLVRLRADLRTEGSPAADASAGTRAPSPRTVAGEGYSWAAATAALPDRPRGSNTVKHRAFMTWARMWRRPRTYRWSTRITRTLQVMAPRGVARLPIARHWAATRELPRPAPRSFLDEWQSR